MTNSVQVELKAVVNITTISSLKSQLDDALEKSVDVVLMGENVEKVDTAALQLLAVFNEKLKSDGNSLRWEKPSDEVCNVAGLLGLQSAVSLPISD
ncbi:MAG: STAS domain-containing protein [Pseudomonadales bacterium]|nr:STAS domain-containing protein [Pseudomonadales bacterium]